MRLQDFPCSHTLCSFSSALSSQVVILVSGVSIQAIWRASLVNFPNPRNPQRPPLKVVWLGNASFPSSRYWYLCWARYFLLCNFYDIYDNDSGCFLWQRWSSGFKMTCSVCEVINDGALLGRVYQDIIGLSEFGVSNSGDFGLNWLLCCTSLRHLNECGSIWGTARRLKAESGACSISIACFYNTIINDYMPYFMCS